MLVRTPTPPLAWLETPAAWILVSAALSLGTIAMVTLLRTRWRDAKPWKKCAILSLWVHVLLAFLAAFVQIVSGGPGSGDRDDYGRGEPIRVAILPAMALEPATPIDSPESELEDDAEPPEPVEAPDPAEDLAAESPEPAPAPLDPAPPEAPELLAEPAPAEPPETTRQEPAPVPAADAIESAEVATDAEPSVATDAQTQITDQTTGDATPSDVQPTAPPTPAPPQPPAAYASRAAANRAELVAAGGGDPRTERAVQAALVWLVAAQSTDGRWDASRHGAGQERFVFKENRGGAGAEADTGVSGLALLAFLGAGHTHRDGQYAGHVAAGLEFLRKSQRSDGNLCGDAEFFARMYCHSMATFAASEAYAMTRDERLAPLVRSAIGYTLAAQHSSDGGWRYRPGLEGDTSQLGWQLMALKSAKLAEIDVPAVTWTRAERFMRRVERGRSGGLTAYRPDGPPTRSMTAEGLYCRQLLSTRADGALSPAAIDEALDSLLDELPSPDAINLYYWYYATLALHHAQHASPAAAEAWRQWNEAMTATLLKTQNADGSWPETCLWGGYGGRVFTTALGAMCLEVYYRYAPDDGADVARRGWQTLPMRQ